MKKKFKAKYHIPLTLLLTVLLITSCRVPAEVRTAMETLPDNFSETHSGFLIKCETRSIPYWVNVGISAIIGGAGNYGAQLHLQLIIGSYSWKSCWLEGTLDLRRHGVDPISIDDRWRIGADQKSDVWDAWARCANRGLQTTASATFSKRGRVPDVVVQLPARCI
ncbi:MAG: hypothetical protein OXH31_10465 [Gammaproteobacteria bacterium]|nr:hypothetical protein [Gammaproteobacteria bacterium]